MNTKGLSPFESWLMDKALELATKNGLDLAEAVKQVKEAVNLLTTPLENLQR